MNVPFDTLMSRRIPVFIMRIRIPSKSARDDNELRGREEQQRERKKKREKDAGISRRSSIIDITQAVALNDYDTGTRYIVALLMRTIAREFSQSRQKEGSRANMRDRGKVHRARNNRKT